MKKKILAFVCASLFLCNAAVASSSIYNQKASEEQSSYLDIGRAIAPYAAGVLTLAVAVGVVKRLFFRGKGNCCDAKSTGTPADAQLDTPASDAEGTGGTGGQHDKDE